MDGLEHLEPFIETTLPILVLTSRKDARTFDLLRSIRYDGLYDGHAEGMENLPTALQQVLQRRLYVSPTMVEHLKRPKNITLDALTSPPNTSKSFGPCRIASRRRQDGADAALHGRPAWT